MVKKPMTGTESDEGDQERLLGRIAAGVAHDLNNYLCAMDGLLALLEAAPNDIELIRRARVSIEQGMRLAGSLVGYVCGESPRFSVVDLGALVNRTLALVARVVSPDITVRVDIAAPLPAVRGSASELEQLVLNLVLNAADAMPDGGELAVRVQPTGGAVVYLEISDTGVGMPAAALVTSDGRTASTRPGRRAGLGLGIVRRVIEQHGGSLEIAPRIDGRGTVVWALLPTA